MNIVVCNGGRERLCFVSLLQSDTLLFDNLNRAVENRCVFQMNDAASRAGFEMPFNYLAVSVFVRPEIVAHSLFVHVKFFGDTVDTTGGQGVLDAAQLLESDIHKPQFW